MLKNKFKLKRINRSSIKDSRTSKSSIEENSKRILSKESSFDIHESYKELRTNIMFSLPVSGCKVISVTSGIASEGKSTTCFNVAITFAETGAKVIVVDCDLRRPNVANLLQIKKDKGLSNVLIKDCSLEDAIIATEYTNLDTLVAGKIPPNPAELLSSAPMKELIDTLKQRYDYIFLDTPPVNVVTDASLLTKLVDGYIIVVKQFRAEKTALVETVRKLNFVDAKILGFILNGVRYTKMGYGKYGYGKYGYGKYGYGRYGRYYSNSDNQQ